MARRFTLSLVCTCGLVLACALAPLTPTPAASFAATPKAETEKAKAIIEGPSQIAPGDLLILDGTKSQATDWKWLVIPSKTILPVEGGRRLVFAVGQPGTYQFILSVANQASVDSTIFAVTVGPPPGPSPSPSPPGPVPPSPTPPSPQAGLRVLFVEESADRARLPREQYHALYSPNVASYLNAKCAAGPSGTPDWRRWDDDADVSLAGPIFREMLSAPRQSLPWVVIRGDAGIVASEPLPKNEAELLSLLRRHGG